MHIYSIGSRLNAETFHPVRSLFPQPVKLCVGPLGGLAVNRGAEKIMRFAGRPNDSQKPSLTRLLAGDRPAVARCPVSQLHGARDHPHMLHACVHDGGPPDEYTIYCTLRLRAVYDNYKFH